MMANGDSVSTETLLQQELVACQQQITRLKAWATITVVIAVAASALAGLAMFKIHELDQPKQWLQVERLTAKEITIADDGDKYTMIYPGHIWVRDEQPGSLWLSPQSVRLSTTNGETAAVVALSEAGSGLLQLNDSNGLKLIGMGQVDGDRHGIVGVHDPEGRYLRSILAPRKP